SPSQPSVIAGSTAVTTGIANQYSVTNEAGITYAWNAGTGGTVTGSGNSVAISWSSAGTKTITLTPSNGCGNGTTRTLNVTVSDCAVPLQPSVITGSATACTVAGGTYSVTNVSGVNYTWNAGTDGFVSGSGNSVTLSWTSVGVKTVTVTPSNACGNGTPRTLAVTVSQLPAQPSAITGNITPCRNASLAYSVTNMPGVTYTWDVLGTGTITGSGNSVNVTWPATGSHTLRVTPSNACGAGVATTLAVTVNDVPLAASQMTGLTSVCSGNSIPYSVGNLAGVTYTWNGGSGSTVTGSGSAVSISWSTGGTKTISVTPSNACGNGIASTKTVEVSTTPAQPSTIVGSTTAVGGVAQSYSVTNIPGVTYTW
ncbi:MAG: PKD domain-containing protein, partial [Cyclobacteriaceae bacterium]|nr:PKD domain-containing protein [Cyclobacteriaceae bacterium]